MALMTRCEEQPDREPVLLADAVATVLDGIGFASRGDIPAPVPDPAAGTATTCARCGRAALWHRTTGGRWIMIEPGERLTAAVPAGRRWRVAGDGTAVDLRSAVPSDTCRISHFDVCPAGPPPVASPVVPAQWRRRGTGLSLS
ncbi:MULTISPECIES: DUF6083 domain-containing protein [unclassified Streptomyces]|uniref:DUF6083 domain-containing protein n=1 Tax=unclassified Streptomyces TaxID=2593676 RepID=UPI00381B0F45